MPFIAVLQACAHVMERKRAVKMLLNGLCSPRDKNVFQWDLRRVPAALGRQSMLIYRRSSACPPPGKWCTSNCAPTLCAYIKFEARRYLERFNLDCNSFNSGSGSANPEGSVYRQAPKRRQGQAGVKCWPLFCAPLSDGKWRLLGNWCAYQRDRQLTAPFSYLGPIENHTQSFVTFCYILVCLNGRYLNI